jgi:hypothetical protein
LQIKNALSEIARLSAAGLQIEMVVEGAQPYALTQVIQAPSPPWDRDSYGILISLPLAYDLGTPLDGFYLQLPYKFQSGDHNRVNGQVITLRGCQWKAVSWHYPDGKQFRLGVDNLESHVFHCRGFFLQRGAINARL